MESNENDENMNEEAPGARAAPAEMNTAEVREAVQRMQESLSRFMQRHQRTHETLSRQMDDPLDRVWKLEQKFEDVRRATERNRDMIRNYRY